MNGRKANLAFLITTICYIGLIYVLARFFPAVSESLILSNLLCELAVILPVMFFTVLSGEKLKSFLGFHKIKISTVLMIVLFTFLSLPALSLFNLISQLWVENEVAAMLESQGQISFGALFLSVGVIAPVFEETACRGFYYRAYQRSGGAFKALFLSALLFALMHMNFNQAAYAFVMGMLAVLLVEAAGSLWAGILYHGLINGSQALVMYGILRTDPESYSSQAAVVTNDILLYGIAVYVVLTAIGLTRSWAVLVWISNNEGRRGKLMRIWRERKEQRDKVVTLPLILSILLCIGVMSGVLLLIFMR